MMHLIPEPKSAAGGETLRPLAPHLRFPAEFSGPASAFCRLAERLYGIPFLPGEAPGGVSLTLDPALKADEYLLDASGTACEDSPVCVLRAGGPAGAAYALATLLQLLSGEEDGYRVPDAVISDRPDCGYRGLMVDLARKRHDFRTVLEYVDLCFLYKIGQLQLHFVDNEGYTLCSEVCPLAPSEGHYTREQIAELVEYAYERNVELIPEFETPGHSNALIRAYPEIFGVETGNSGEFTINGQAVDHSIVCIGRPSAVETTRALIREVIEMFPHSPCIHLGGDEANISLWKECRLCREEMTRRGAANEKEMYGLWMKDVTDFVLECGRTPVVWEGFPKESAPLLSKKVRVIAWENYYNPMPGLLEQGFPLINCSWKPLYIVPTLKDWDEQTILDWNVWNWQHWWEKSAACGAGISVEPTPQLLGAQLCAWECTYEEEIGRVRRYLAALSERTWNAFRPADQTNFAAALPKLEKLARSLAGK